MNLLLDTNVLLFGMTDDLRLGPEARLRLAVQYGAAAASLPGTQAPTPADLPTGDVPVSRLV